MARVARFLRIDASADLLARVVEKSSFHFMAAAENQAHIDGDQTSTSTSISNLKSQTTISISISVSNLNPNQAHFNDHFVRGHVLPKMGLPPNMLLRVSKVRAD